MSEQVAPANLTESQKMKTDEHGVPLWILAPTEEKTLLKEHQAWTEKMCEVEFREFAECCQNYPLLFPFRCPDKKEAMTQCVAHYGSPAMFNKLRETYIERKIAFREKLEKKA